MTEKEIKVREFVEAAENALHQAIETSQTRQIGTALKHLLAAKVLLEAVEIRPVNEYETPEQPKIDAAALEIIQEPIADEVPLETPKEDGPRQWISIPKQERLELEKEILMYRHQKMACASVAEKMKKEHDVLMSPQTVMNIEKKYKDSRAKRERLGAQIAHYPQKEKEEQ